MASKRINDLLSVGGNVKKQKLDSITLSSSCSSSPQMSSQSSSSSSKRNMRKEIQEYCEVYWKNGRVKVPDRYGVVWEFKFKHGEIVKVKHGMTTYKLDKIGVGKSFDLVEDVRLNTKNGYGSYDELCFTGGNLSLLTSKRRYLGAMLFTDVNEDDELMNGSYIEWPLSQ